MKAALQAWATANGATFDYARPDFANLVSELDEDRTHIILYPVKETDQVTESGIVSERTYEGTFLAVRRSDMDEAYSAANYQNEGPELGKYERYIEPVKSEMDMLLFYLTACDEDFTVTQWVKEEVVNMMNYNLDGVYVRYRVTSQWV